jgi:ankyrin repeat protein
MARKTEQFIDIANKLVDILKKIKNPHTSIIEEELFLDKYPILNKFSDICEQGNLQEAEKFLLEHPTIVETTHFDDALISACANGHLEIAKRLREIKPTMDISMKDEQLLRGCCFDGNLEVFKWLFEINPYMNLSIYNDEPFQYACLSGNLELAELILEKKGRMDVSVFDRTFSYLCCNIIDTRLDNGIVYNGCRTYPEDVAEWLLNKYPSIDILGDDDINVKNAFRYDKIELVQWIQRLKPEKYYIELDDVNF